jgi:hypothetical protein
LFIALAAGACTSGGGPVPAGPRGSMDRITEQELAPVSQLSAFEAIQRLRPRWFQTRTGTLPVVHVDGAARADGEEILRAVLCSDVQEMRYLNGPDATTRFGTGYGSGAILITTKK